MVTVLGHRGMLGSVVARRWLELGDTDHTVNCIRPDDLELTRRVRPISPSTDAIFERSDYAWTKRQLERISGLVVIRSGIVDIRHRYTNAYTNWICNPLTPLEWADLAWEMRDTPGVHIAGRETVSRWEVEATIARWYGGPDPIAAGYWPAPDRVQPVDRPRPTLAVAVDEYLTWLNR